MPHAHPEVTVADRSTHVTAEPRVRDQLLGALDRELARDAVGSSAFSDGPQTAFSDGPVNGPAMTAFSDGPAMTAFSDGPQAASIDVLPRTMFSDAG